MPWDPVLRLFEARTDLFSFPYFGTIYPFYWTLGIGRDLSLEGHLLLDTLSVVFHQVAGACLFAWFLHRVGVRPLLAALGGIAYAYSLHLKDWASWMWAFSAYAWIPLCMLGAWSIAAESRYRAGTFYLALGIGLVSLGSALPLAYAVSLTGIVAIAGFVHAHSRLADTARGFAAITAGGLLGGLLGATHLVPVLIRNSEYIRWFSGGAVVGGFKPPYEATLVATIDAWGPLHLLLPLRQKGGLGIAFVGGAMVFLAAYLLLGSSRWRRFCLVLLAAATYFFLDAMGDLTPVHRLTYQLPLLGAVRYPIANVVITITCLLTAGTLGAEHMCRRLERGDSLRGWGVGLIAFFLGLGIAGFGLREHVTPQFTAGAGLGFLWLSLAIGAGVGVALAWGPGRRLASALPIALLLGWLPTQVLLLPKKALTATTEYLACDQYQELVHQLRSWRGEVGEEARLAVWWAPDGAKGPCLSRLMTTSMLLESTAMALGWNVRSPYISPRPVHEFRLFSHDVRLKSKDHLLQAGITHVITNLAPDLMPSFYRQMHSGSSLSLYEVADTRTATVTSGCLVLEGKAIWLVNGTARRKLGLSPDDTLGLLSQLSCEPTTLSRTIGPETLVRRSPSGSRVTYSVSAAQASLLVTDRVSNPSWRIEVNGRQVPDIVADGYRIAIPLRAGDNRIVLTYRPWDFRLGVWLTMLGLLGAGAVGLWPTAGVLRHHRPRSQVS